MEPLLTVPTKKYQHCAPHNIRVWFGANDGALYPQPKCEYDDCNEQSMANAWQCPKHLIEWAYYTLQDQEYVGYSACLAAVVSAIGMNGRMTINTDKQITSVTIVVEGMRGLTNVGRAGEKYESVLERALKYLMTKED